MFSDECDSAHEVCKALKREKFTLNRHKKLVCSCERIQSEKTKRRRTVDKNIIILVFYGVESALQEIFARDLGNKLDFSPGKRNIRGGDLRPGIVV